MNIREAIEILMYFNDGYTFQSCQTCFKFNEKDSCCNKEKCDELVAIETVLAELEKKDNIVRGIIQRLDNDIKNISKTKSDGKHADDYSRCRLKAYKTKTKEIKEYIEKQYFEKKIEEDK